MLSDSFVMYMALSSSNLRRRECMRFRLNASLSPATKKQFEAMCTWQHYSNVETCFIHMLPIENAKVGENDVISFVCPFFFLW